MIEILVLLIAAVTAVLLFSRLGLGGALGYLAAGVVIGPSGLQLIADPENIRHIGEFGVVFLLFLIGIEIKPQRLWVMRKLVFGLGGAQVVITGVVFSLLAYGVLDVGVASALIIGFGLSLSSTAFGLQIMAERNQLTSQWGRAGFSTLILQDLAVVPLLALVPLLASGNFDLTESMELAVLESLAIFIAALVGGRLAVGPALRVIAQSRSKEAFSAAALLLVLGAAWIMEQAGLSMAMGAFVAGILLADNEYRHQVEADVEPFRGLLLGLFFMSVGMAIDPASLVSHTPLVLGGTVVLLAIKAIIIFGLARIFRLPRPGAFRVSFLLSQAGEFGFVLFTLADSSAVLPAGMLAPLISIIVLSMAATPLMMRAGEYLARRSTAAKEVAVPAAPSAAVPPVIIAGFGRVGETVAHMLSILGQPWVAIDMDAERVTKGRGRGFRVYYGDASQETLLKAVQIGQARLVVITLDNPRAVERTIRTVKRLAPEVPVIVRARDMTIAETYAAMGAVHVVPEAIESSIQLGAMASQVLGIAQTDVQHLLDVLRADKYEKLRSEVSATDPGAAESSR